MKTKHTPGQWKATGLEIRHANRSIILANVYEHLPANQSREEAEANAELIAAAPELLEALETIFIKFPSYGIKPNSELYNIVKSVLIK